MQCTTRKCTYNELQANLSACRQAHPTTGVDREVGFPPSQWPQLQGIAGQAPYDVGPPSCGPRPGAVHPFGGAVVPVCVSLVSVWVGQAILASQVTHRHTHPCRRGLPTDRYMWSDATGLQECTKAGTKPPSLQWSWVSSSGGAGRGWSGRLTCTDPTLPQVSDWSVDFSVPGGTDQEGWQYASDFPS